MAVLNLRDVPDELAAKLKSEAALAGISLRELCVGILTIAVKYSGKNWPWDGYGYSGAESVISKKIADVADGDGEVEGGGTPSLPRVGKAQGTDLDEIAVKFAGAMRDNLRESGRRRKEENISKIAAASPQEFVSMAERRRFLANLRDGIPCGHAGCLSHVSHPCEGCGRIAGRRPIYNMEDNEAARKSSTSGDVPVSVEALQEKIKSLREMEIANCPDCIACKKHAYSDATTPGFFYTECEKHRRYLAEPDDIRNAAGVVIQTEMPIEEAKRRFSHLVSEQVEVFSQDEQDAEFASENPEFAAEVANRLLGGESVPPFDKCVAWGCDAPQVKPYYACDKHLKDYLPSNAIDDAKINGSIAAKLNSAGVELDREILVRWGLADNYKPKTESMDEKAPDAKGRAKKSGNGKGSGKTAATNTPANDGTQDPAMGVGKPKVDMQALRDICAGKNLGETPLSSPAPIEIDLCGFKSYNEEDGEWYMCGKEKHEYPKFKHGDWMKV